MANNKKKTEVAKKNVEPKTKTTSEKTDIIKKAMDKVADTKADAQARYDAAVAGLVIVRH